jgi:hypothetical protein
LDHITERLTHQRCREDREPGQMGGVTMRFVCLSPFGAPGTHPAECLRPTRSPGAKRVPRQWKGTFYAIVLALAWSFAFAADPPRYRLTDSGFPADDWYQPFWIDNERLIFKGFEVGSYSKEMHEAPFSEQHAKGYDGHGMRTGYYVWDTKKNTVTLYKDKITNLCAEDGNVVYQTTGSEKAVVWRGKFGEEQPTTIEPVRLNFNELRVSCWDRWPQRTEAQKGRRILHLRAGWGYLDAGPSDPPFDLKAPVLYYREGSSTPTTLPIPVGKLINAGYVRFVPHENRHLIVEGNVSRERDAWFMTRDGKLTEVILPPGPWLSERLYPVKGGLFLSSAHTRGKKILEPGGAYLILDGEWWRLLFTGIKGRAAISQDGCKVALVVTPDDKALRESFREWMAGRPSQKTMRMINVCQGEKK